MNAPTLWQLSASKKENEAYALAEQLGFLESSEALSVSVFEANNGLFTVEAIYDAEENAKTAQALLGGRVEQIADKDWVSETQAGLPPVTAGRFIVHGSHDHAPDQAGVVPILVDAGLAFGTGHHGTTKGCLLIFDKLVDDHDINSVLDVGTGAGVLAIAAAKTLQNADILATDIDPDAVMVTQQNMALNSVAFDCVQADGFDSPALKDRQFDLVFANILAGPLREMAEDIAQAIRPGGHAILSGILKEQADWVTGAFEAAGLAVKPQAPLEGWTSLLAQKTDS